MRTKKLTWTTWHCRDCGESTFTTRRYRPQVHYRPLVRCSLCGWTGTPIAHHRVTPSPVCFNLSTSTAVGSIVRGSDDDTGGKGNWLGKNVVTAAVAVVVNEVWELIKGLVGLLFPRTAPRDAWRNASPILRSSSGTSSRSPP